MALSPEAMRAQEQDRARQDQEQRGSQPTQTNPSGFQDPMPGPATPVVDGAPRFWTLYPYPQPPSLPVLPAGMWPWESPLSKAFRAEKGENPHEPPLDYDKIMSEALGFPYTEHAFSGEAPPETSGGVPAEGPHPGERQPGRQGREASPPPAASQH